MQCWDQQNQRESADCSFLYRPDAYTADWTTLDAFSIECLSGKIHTPGYMFWVLTLIHESISMASNNSNNRHQYHENQLRFITSTRLCYKGFIWINVFTSHKNPRQQVTPFYLTSKYMEAESYWVSFIMSMLNTV